MGAKVIKSRVALVILRVTSEADELEQSKQEGKLYRWPQRSCIET